MDEQHGFETNGEPVKRELVLNLPSPDSPGFLRRSRQALELSEQLNPRVPESIDMIVEFLLPYVVAPHNRGEAREALLDATEKQIGELLDAIAGGSADPLSARARRGK